MRRAVTGGATYDVRDSNDRIRLEDTVIVFIADEIAFDRSVKAIGCLLDDLTGRRRDDPCHTTVRSIAAAPTASTVATTHPTATVMTAAATETAAARRTGRLHSDGA